MNAIKVRFSDIRLSEIQKVEITESGSTLTVDCTPIGQKDVYRATVQSDKFPALSAQLVLNGFSVRAEPSGMILAIRSGAVRAG